MLRNVHRNAALQENGMEIADSRWEILLKAVEQPLGTAKGYRKPAGKWPKAIGQPLGNS
jgi:hypothetical protein